MMRCLSMDQRNLYDQYAKLSQELARILNHSENQLAEGLWELICKEGFFELAVSRDYGGRGLSWQDCVVALDGLLSYCPDIGFLSAIMSQISVIYLISEYGTEFLKKKYLPRLMQGEIASIRIPEQIHKLHQHNSWLKSVKWHLIPVGSYKIMIHAKKVGKKISFYLSEKRPNTSTFVTEKEPIYLNVQNQEIISEETGLVALYDLINFERIFYGILAVSFVRRCDLKRA